MTAIDSHSLTLYCDNRELPCVCLTVFDQPQQGEHQFSEFPMEYNGRTGTECRQKARQAGWRFRRDKTICPRCAV